jgi:tetratricopeptide (TPR) repeat protein
MDMENKLESPETKASETKNVIQEFGEKISQALEMEKKKMREQAEEEAKQIIARAKDEAGRYIIQAKQESEKEADIFFNQVQEKAEQILKESREKAAIEARRESDKIISETREKAAQIIKDVIESSINRVKTDLSGITSEAKNKLEIESSRLYAVSKNIEQITGETQSNIQSRIDNLVGTITETGNRLQSLSDTTHKTSNVSEVHALGDTIEIKRAEKPDNRVNDASPPPALKKVPETRHIETPKNQETAVSQMQATVKAGIASIENLEVRKIPKAVQEPVSVEVMETEEPGSLEDIEKQMQKGIALLDAEKSQEALVVFTKVIEIDPDNALAWRKMGTTLGMLGRHMEALKALRKATKLTPKDITAWHNTEIILRKLGQKKEAKEAKEMEKLLIKQYPDQYKEIVKKSQ